MKNFLLCLAVVLLNACSHSSLTEQKEDRKFDGVWQGFGVQDNDTSWLIKMTLRAGRYAIDYPSLNCGGTLTLLRQDAISIEFNEKITYGKDICVDNGRTVLVQRGIDSAQFRWYYPDGKQGALGSMKRMP
jgi:hypothetical protein